MWSATARIRSASPTEVPPNFWTTSGIRTRLQTAHRPDRPGVPPRRPGSQGRPPRWAIRDGPPDWVGSRAVPSDKRARQRAAREARLAAEAQSQKRRKQIRNGIIVVVLVGVIVGIVFLVSGSNNNVASQSKVTTTTTTAAGKSADAKLQAQANEVAVKAGCPASPRRRRTPRSTVGTGHDDRHVQDLHGHRRDHHRHLRHRARRQDRPDHGQQLRVPRRQGLLPLRDLPSGHSRLHGPDG